MKKVIYSLCTFMICLMTACGSSSKDSKEEGKQSSDAACSVLKLAQEITENGNWDNATWNEKIKDIMQKELEFYKSMPSQEELDEYDRACEELFDAAKKLNADGNHDFWKARRDAGTKLKNDIFDARKKAVQNAKQSQKQVSSDDDLNNPDESAGYDADYDIDNYD